MGAAVAVEAEEDGAGFTGAAGAEDPVERLCDPPSVESGSNCAEEDAMLLGEADEAGVEDPGSDLREDGAVVSDPEGLRCKEVGVSGVGGSGSDPVKIAQPCPSSAQVNLPRKTWRGRWLVADT